MAKPDSPEPGLVERLRRFVGAWQPFTGAGLAAFGDTSLSRLITFQLIAAVGIAVLVVGALRWTWVPVIERALPNLPESAPLQACRLLWPDTEARRLAENAWLAVVVRPSTNSAPDDPGQTADLQLELQPSGFRIEGIFGHVDRPYPRTLNADLGRIPATAAWNAWRRPAAAMLGLGFTLFLMVSWWGLATAYAPFAWAFARVCRRPLSLAAAWKISAAALFVGAAVGAAGFAGYATGAIRLPGVLVTQALHVPIGWIWLIWGLLSSTSTPRPARSKASNPFAGSK